MVGIHHGLVITERYLLKKAKTGRTVMTNISFSAKIKSQQLSDFAEEETTE
jgi:hypothetical protein